jgi:hypothetical protein
VATKESKQENQEWLRCEVEKNSARTILGNGQNTGMSTKPRPTKAQDKQGFVWLATRNWRIRYFERLTSPLIPFT